MSSFLCFICHSTVNSEISDETREKYREVVGMNLCPDSQLCHICCHVLNKLSLFKCICLKRSLEYPVLFSEKGTLNLQRNNINVLTICSDNSCTELQRCKNIYQFTYDVEEDRFNDDYNEENEYVALEDNFNDLHPINIHYEVKTEMDETAETVKNETDFSYNDKGLCEMDCLEDNEAECTDINDTTNFNDGRDKVDNTFNDVNDKVDDTFNDDIREKRIDTLNDDMNDGVDDFNEKVDDTLNDGNDKINDNFNDDIDHKVDDNFNNDDIEEKRDVKKGKKKHKKKEENIIILSIEEQKAELEARRKEKKYLEAEFKCYNCAMAFLFKDTYQAHMMRHEESNGEYKCVVCTLRFASPAVLRAHAATHARRCGCGARLRRCGCGAPREPPQRVACHLCGHLLKDANGLQQHLRRVHKSKMSNRLHPCTVCGENFPSQATMRTHMIKHINRKFHCDQCPAVYSSPYTLARHRGTHAATAEYKCGCGARYASRAALVAHAASAAVHRRQGKFHCDQCPAVYSSPYTLARHRGTHAATAEFKCGCGARYASRAALAAHAASAAVHRRQGKFHCDQCPAVYSSPYTLARHRGTHAATAEYKCGCGARYASRAALAAHAASAAVHRRQGKFHCDQCPAVYSSPYTLARHRGTHAATAEYKCGCGARYASRAALAAHAASAAVHRRQGLECPMCAKISPNQRALNLHIQALHSNTKEHTCPHCPARYSTRPSLLRHIASHTQKPQPKTAMCHLCGSSFKTNSKLNRHLKNVCEKDKLEEQLDSLYG